MYCRFYLIVAALVYFIEHTCVCIQTKLINKIRDRNDNII